MFVKHLLWNSYLDSLHFTFKSQTISFSSPTFTHILPRIPFLLKQKIKWLEEQTNSMSSSFKLTLPLQVSISFPITVTLVLKYTFYLSQRLPTHSTGSPSSTPAPVKQTDNRNVRYMEEEAWGSKACVGTGVAAPKISRKLKVNRTVKSLVDVYFNIDFTEALSTLLISFLW